MKYRREIALGGGVLSMESGHLAKQADGSCTTQYGDTMVLTTACMAPNADPDRGFLPLTVDYREYTAAGGRIPGGFFKREGRPSEKETITSRLIDRPIRPLFPEGHRHETQVISRVLSADGENDPDVLAINGASAALVLSAIPFYHPIGAVRVGMIDGDVIFNPPNSQRDVSDLDLVVVGTEEAVVMVEAAANQLLEAQILDCIFQAHTQIKNIIQAQKELFQDRNLEKPDWAPPELYSPALLQEVKEKVNEELGRALHTGAKFERRDAVNTVKQQFLETVAEDELDEKRPQIKRIFSLLEEEHLRNGILDNGQRFDGRSPEDIRQIDIEVGLLPRTHGSALFTRGETQALGSVTLGTRRDAQVVEEYEGETLQKFLLHYNFPPFSVGEVKPMRGTSRREIGHGVLARRALMPVLPHEDEFPYTVRVMSEILESNGSSSMATICAGSMALFDAGVPLVEPVAGVAMGLVKDGERFSVLTDIAGQEDHYGDMDFKVAGTHTGITALQMDIKIGGVSQEIMAQALAQAQTARLKILAQMEAILAKPRPELSVLAPRLHTMQISTEKIRDVIGPGGKTIRSIVEETGCEVEIENDGKVIIASPDGDAAKRAIAMIERLTEIPEVGRLYTGPVRRVEPYGAFVEILPGTDGLVHISELAPYRVGEVTDVVNEGDELTVKVIDIDPSNNKVRLSRRAVIMESPDYDPQKYEGMGSQGGDSPPPGRYNDRDRGGRRGGRGGRGAPRGGRSHA